MAHYAVIGAGWAGLSAAARLTAAGHPCTLFEAARSAGGRARRVPWPQPDGHTWMLDNGQHILLGAYREVLDLQRLVGVDARQVFRRLPLRLEGSDGLRLHAPRLPAPLHLVWALLTARGLDWHDRTALLRTLGLLRWQGWRIAPDCTVAAWLTRTAQPANLRRRLWEPLCIAALNTPAATASAQVFAHVLRDSLGAARAASDLLLPATDLGAVLPDGVLDYVARQGMVRLGTRITALTPGTAGMNLTDAEGNTTTWTGAVLAVPANQAARLLEPLPGCAALAADCRGLRQQSITTVYLRYANTAVRLPFAMQALTEDPSTHAYGQWVFDRGQLGGPDGLLAVVISADGPHRTLNAPQLVNAITQQLRQQLGVDGPVQDSRVIIEKNATFACTPGLRRPAVQTPLPRLMLAGDYCASDYPATLESAVASGRQAATALLAARPTA